MNSNVVFSLVKKLNSRESGTIELTREQAKSLVDFFEKFHSLEEILPLSHSLVVLYNQLNRSFSYSISNIKDFSE